MNELQKIEELETTNAPLYDRGIAIQSYFIANNLQVDYKYNEEFSKFDFFIGGICSEFKIKNLIKPLKRYGYSYISFNGGFSLILKGKSKASFENNIQSNNETKTQHIGLIFMSILIINIIISCIFAWNYPSIILFYKQFKDAWFYHIITILGFITGLSTLDTTLLIIIKIIKNGYGYLVAINFALISIILIIIILLRSFITHAL